MRLARRDFLTGSGVVGLVAGLSWMPNRAMSQGTCRRVNGAGSYALGPFEPVVDGAEPVYLVTDLGFDETMVYCKVTTNFAAFRFPTAEMGVVEIGAHQFFMNMESTRITSLDVDTGDDGLQAVYQGVLRSETRLFSGDATQTFVEENIIFGCHAVVQGPQAAVEITPKNFAMTVNFDPEKEQSKIFGPQAVFAGQLSQGNIIVQA